MVPQPRSKTGWGEDIFYAQTVTTIPTGTMMTNSTATTTHDYNPVTYTLSTAGPNMNIGPRESSLNRKERRKKARQQRHRSKQYPRSRVGVIDPWF